MFKLYVSVIWLVAAFAACKLPGEEPPAAVQHTVELSAVPVRVDDPEMIQYTLRFARRHNHYVEVEAVFPAGHGSLELSMAVWTPGSYMVREYSRHIEALAASTPAGEVLPITKVAKNRWRVDSGSAERVAVQYRLYARELTVRTNYVTSEIAMLNGAATFLTIADDKTRPFDIALELPQDWSACATALEPHPDGAHRYLAPDYDTLVDSPIVAGVPARYEFAVAGVPHVLVNFGEGGVWDGARSARDVEALTRAQTEFWGEVPYPRYVFLNVLLEGGGGLEHKASTLMIGSRWATRKRDTYQDWLGLVSHEFFHTWNVKRLRPHELGPFDYENENYTRSLWIAEGITSYYDDLLLTRAGLLTRDEYLERLSEQIEGVQSKPGRAMQSLSDSSFDAWIKFYRPNENSDNSQVSYYEKGAVVGFLLDAEIRRASRGRYSLDDVMRRAYQRFAAGPGYTPEEFRALAAEVAGQSLDDFFARAVDSTAELDYAPALAWYGLRFAAAPDKKPEKEEPAGYLGVELDEHGEVESVVRDAPAFHGGINAGDEIVALDNYRVKPGELGKHLERYRPGTQVSVLVARRGDLRTIPVTLGETPKTTWKLELDPKASPLARTHLAGWLNILADATPRPAPATGPADVATPAGP